MFSKNRKKKESESPTPLSNPTDSIENQSLPSLPRKSKPKSANIKKRVSPVKKIKDKAKPKKEESTKKTSSLLSKLSPRKPKSNAINTQSSQTDNDQSPEKIAPKNSSSKKISKSKSPIKRYTKKQDVSSENSLSEKSRSQSVESTMDNDVISPSKGKTEKRSFLKSKLKKKVKNTTSENLLDKSGSQSEDIESPSKGKTEKSSFLESKLKKKKKNTTSENLLDKSGSQSDDIESPSKGKTEKSSFLESKLKKKEKNTTSENLLDKSGSQSEESPSKGKTEKRSFLESKLKKKKKNTTSENLLDKSGSQSDDIESPSKGKTEKSSFLESKLKKKEKNTTSENLLDKSGSQSEDIESPSKGKTEKRSFLESKLKKKKKNTTSENLLDKSGSQSDDIESPSKGETKKRSFLKSKLKKKKKNASSENLLDKSRSQSDDIESSSKGTTKKRSFLKSKFKKKEKNASSENLLDKSGSQSVESTMDNGDIESPSKGKTKKRSFLERKFKKKEKNTTENLLSDKSRSQSVEFIKDIDDTESPSKGKTEKISFLKRKLKKKEKNATSEKLLNDKSESQSDDTSTDNNDKESPSKKKTDSKPENRSFFGRKIKNKKNNDSPQNLSTLKQNNHDISYKKSAWKSMPNRNNYTKLQDSSGSEDQLQSKRSIQLPKLQPVEADFLQLVTDDNIDGIHALIKEKPELNINCINFQGVSALHLAVQNRSEAMVEFLLHQPDIDIGDTILHAVRDNNLKILVMLLDAQKKISPGLEFAGATHSADFPNHVTPLILAAQEGHYEAVALLVSRGHKIVRPHPPNCPCIDCKNSLASDDPLDISSARLSIYRAISSPAYLVHISSDPILSAFRLTSELSENAGAYRQLAAAYLQLRDDVSAFAVDLIGCCRTSEEVEIILKHSSGSRGRRHFILPRLLMAVDYKQKAFVAHPNTQQVLESYWCGNWYSWRSKSSLKKSLTVLSRVFVTPIILVMCMIVPRSQLVKHWQIPLNKLITHAASYFVFLAIIFYISDQDKTEVKRGAPKTGAEPVLVLYVCGYIWSAVRLCVMQGPKRYFTELWNWGEIIMLLLFIMTFILWLAAAIDVQRNDREYLERKFWNQYDPTLMAEGTFCLATIIAYFRLMFLCQLNYHLGPLQVSLGKMTVDIYKYITVFAIIICSFAAGLARFYQYYDGMVYQDEFGMKTVQVSSFTSLRDTLNTLFWALFCMSPLESADVIIENTKDPKHPDQELDNKHEFTERVGYFCFACFEVISVIVVLNMLIATMSNTFQRVTDNVAIEWTFGRTEVYVDYMSQTTLPSPYNLIPTAACMDNILEWFGAIIRRRKGVYARWSLSYCCYIERDVEAAVKDEYPILMSILVQRYFRDKESGLVGDTAIESELEALRREIVTLKTIIEKQYSK